MIFNEDLFYHVPKYIIKEIKKTIDEYGVCLSDAIEWTFRDYAKQGSELWKAWYYSDYRRFIPSWYSQEELDFNKHPLKYRR